MADQGDWVGAADRFERAHSLKPTAGIAFNWASALVETGKLLEAQELLHRIVRDPSIDAELKRQSELLLASVEPRVAHVRVRVVGPLTETATLEVDGVAWPRAAWDVTSPFDPGTHQLVLKSGDVEYARTELKLVDGDTRELVLNAGKVEPAAGPRVGRTERHTAPRKRVIVQTQEVQPAQADADERPLRKNWMLWTAVGTVVAGGVVTAVLLTRDRDAPEQEPVPGSGGVIRW